MVFTIYKVIPLLRQQSANFIWTDCCFLSSDKMLELLDEFSPKHSLRLYDLAKSV